MDERFTLCRVEDATWVVTHPTGLSGYDFAFSPTFRVSHPARLDGEVTAIARMGAAADYGARYEALRALGIRLVHTPDTYRRTSLLPVWYPRIEGLTPRSLCFDAPPSAEEVGAALGWPVFVKGARQTSRHNKALCVAKTPAEFDAIMGAWRGDDILWWQPVVCREWAPLRRVAEPSSDLLPLDRPPGDLAEEWAYVFRRAPALRDVPAHVLHEGPRKALEAARSAHFSADEWEAYDRESVAIQDARGAIVFAERRGEARGEARGELRARRQVLRAVLAARGFTLTAAQEARIEGGEEAAELDGWIVRATTAGAVEDVFVGAG